MLAEVLATIASIGDWLIHDLFTSSLSGMVPHIIARHTN